MIVEKFQKMEWNRHQLNQHELEVHEVMRVHLEEGVYPSYYPCTDFMKSAGIFQDVRNLISTTREKLIAALLTAGKSNLKMPAVSYHRRVEMGLPGVVPLPLANWNWKCRR
jgi:hypothetical protein